MGKRNDCRKIVIVMGLALILTFASGCQDKKQEGKGITDDILSDQTDYSMYLRKYGWKVMITFCTVWSSHG